MKSNRNAINVDTNLLLTKTDRAKVKFFSPHSNWTWYGVEFAGPWEVHDAGHPDPSVCVMTSGSTCLVLAEIEPIPDVAISTAHLIAAAPDLYAAVKKFVDYYAGNARAQLGNGTAARCLPLFEEAIKKAEGR